MRPASHTATLSPCRKPLAFAILALALALFPVPIRAQGCVQCQDNTAAASPASQRAYRHAIVLMASAAGIFFIATLIIFKRHSR